MSLKLGVEVYTVRGGDMGISKNSSDLKSHLQRKEKEKNKEKEKGVKELYFLSPEQLWLVCHMYVCVSSYMLV